MSAIRVHLGMAGAGVVAACLASLAFLPVFLMMGGQVRDYLAIVLADTLLVTGVAFVGGGYLAPSRSADHDVVGRSLALGIWLALWAVGAGLGVVGILVDGQRGLDPLWQVVGLLVYALVALILLMPLALALAIQLSVAAQLASRVLASSTGVPGRG
jgi:hypothetical protein